MSAEEIFHPLKISGGSEPGACLIPTSKFIADRCSDFTVCILCLYSTPALCCSFSVILNVETLLLEILSFIRCMHDFADQKACDTFNFVQKNPMIPHDSVSENDVL